MTPGKQLHAARESYNLSQDEMALRLRLNPAIIQAIEEDRYHDYPATYMRGYIRSYARFVGLESEELIQGFNELANQPPVLAPINSPVSHELSSGDLPVQLVTYSIIGFLLFSLFVWWQSRDADIPVPEPVGELIPEFQLPQQTETVQETTPAAPTTAPLVAPPENQAALPEQTPVPGAMAPNSLPQPNGEAVQLPTTSANLATQTATPTTQPSALMPGLPAPGTENTVTGGRTLVIEIPQDAWVDVKDSRKSQLHYGLAKGSQVVTLQGEPPFRAKIGNAYGVKITYNGKPIDITAFSKMGVARFSIGDQGVGSYRY